MFRCEYKDVCLVMLRYSIRHHKVSYDYENNKYREKPKIPKKSARRKCWSHLNQVFFFENFIYDPLNSLAETMTAMNNRLF